MKRFILIVFSIIVLYSTTQAQFAGGSGTEADPYQVATIEQLQEIQNHLDQHFIQTADIEADDSKYWQPIGNSESEFKGSYDGDGYIILGITVRGTQEQVYNYQGLFGYTEGAVLKNITMNTLRISIERWSSHTGGLVGYNGINSSIYNVRVTGSLNHNYEVSPTGASHWGGVVGTNSGTIHKASFHGAVKAIDTGSSFGGLVGTNHGVIFESYAGGLVFPSVRSGGLVGTNHGVVQSSFVSEDTEVRARSGSGGLVGINHGDIFDSFSRASAYCFDSSGGGLVGYNVGGVYRAYATGEVTYGDNRGGLVGINAGYLEQVYAIGSVDDYNTSGGLVGSNTVTGTIKYGYWNLETTGKEDGIGEGKGADDYLSGLTTSQMTGENAYFHMNHLNFNQYWYLTEGYPALRWEQPEDTLAVPMGNVALLYMKVPDKQGTRLISPGNEIDFGEVDGLAIWERNRRGLYEKQEFILRSRDSNTISGDIRVDMVTEQKGNPFELTKGGGLFTLEPDSSLIIEVKFSPLTPNLLIGKLIIDHDALYEDEEPLYIILSGKGIGNLNAVNVLLNQNYPNPFNPSTNIRFSIPEQSHVNLEVYNVLGQRVAILLNENKEAGWYVINFDSANLSSGTYIYRLRTNTQVVERQMMLIK
ncbi:MAG: T9SS type A sorting domain-containing protein [Balneolales bacterium]